MRPKGITSYTDLRGREVTDLRALPSGQDNALPPSVEEPPSAATANTQESPKDVAAKLRDASSSSASYVKSADYVGKISTADGKLNPKGKFAIIVTGPFSAGKDSIIGALSKDNSLNIDLPVRYTSRVKRPNEIDGKDYYFISREQFEKMRDNKEFFLWGHWLEYYGTSLRSLQDAFDNGKVPLIIAGMDEIEPTKVGFKDRGVPYLELFISPLPEEELIKEGGIEKCLEVIKQRIIARGGELKLEHRIPKSRNSLENRAPGAIIIANEDGKLDVAIKKASRLIKAANADHLFTLPKGENYLCFLGERDLDPKDNLVVGVTGTFAGGKNSLVDNAVKVAGGHVEQVIEYTSRPKRPHETNGKEYFFVSKEEFERMIENDEILVYFEWGGDTKEYYGYSVKELQKVFDKNKTPILIQGPTNSGPMVTALKNRNIPVVITFVSPLSKEEFSQEGGIDKALGILEKRMEGTQRNKLQERQEINRAMFESLPESVQVIDNSNGNLDRATVDFLSLIQAKKDEVSAQRIKDKFGDAHPALVEFERTGQISDVHLQNIKLDPKGSFAIILCGPSGVGKSTVLKQAFQDESLKLQKVITNTTRDSRSGEQNGVDYNFLSVGEFEEKIESGDLLEWLQVVNTDFYGSSQSTIQQIFDKGQVPVFDLDPEGSNYYRDVFDKLGIPYIDVFVSPLSKEELADSTNFERGKGILRERIRNRGSGEPPEKVEGRVKKAEKYFKAAPSFTHVIHSVEGDIKGSTSSLKNLVQDKKEELIVKRIKEKHGEKHPSLIEFEKTGQISDDFLAKHSFNSNGQIAIIISGPSGVGKGTILDNAFTDPKFTLGKALTSTTRAKRPNETDGVEYTFITIEDFEKMLESNELFEWLTVVSGKYYAYEQRQIQGLFDDNRDVVFDVVPGVAAFLKEAFKKTGVPVVDIFISPVAKDVLLSQGGLEKALPVLEKRIRNRGSGETEAQVQDRLRMTREFLEAAPTFTNIIENTEGRLPESMAAFKALVVAKKQGISVI